MKEDFLHYVWKFQKFSKTEFKTIHGENLFIRNPGEHNFQSGPDFFNAQLEIGEQLWAGNVEIHLKSSDWYAHGHETDPAYENVILHVVWEHDAEIYRKDGTVIPTFVIRDYVVKETNDQYQKLFAKENKWINCENDLAEIDSFVIDNWLERLYFERLERKEKLLLQEIDNSKNHWEALLFTMLCKNFGLKVNGESFFSIAKSIPFSVVKKCSQKATEMEALLMGQAGFFEEMKEDGYFLTLKSTYDYLKHKFSLENTNVIPPKYFRLRPPNFPTIRLSQLAGLYVKYPNIFAHIIEIKTLDGFYDFFDCMASDYWDSHYNFGVASPKRKKKLTRRFIDLLIINTVLPIKFSYARQLGADEVDVILSIASEIASEDNSIVNKFNSIRPMAHNAFQSQALLELKNEYCDKNRCLECAIGHQIVGKRRR